MTTRKITARAFNGWLESAMRGSKTIYHTGFLAVDKDEPVILTGPKKEPTPEQLALRTLAHTVYDAMKLGLVDLVQKKHADGLYDYCAIKR